jgi:hypothetical protein
VEQTDAEYFAGKTSEMTHFPSQGNYYWGSHGGYNYGRGYLDDGMPEMAADMDTSGGMASAPIASAAGGDVPDGAMQKSAPVPAPAPSNDASASANSATSKTSSGMGDALYTRTKFETTPLFAASVLIGSDGNVLVPFTLPDNIATFDVRVYVSSTASTFGHASTSVKSRRNVSLVPSLPRVVRPGDHFDCGVSVTGITDSAGPGLPEPGVDIKAILSSEALVSLRQADLDRYGVAGATKALSTQMGGGPHEIIFPMSAASVSQGGGIGEAKLTFKASLQGSSTSVLDAFETNLSVKAPQSPVLVATSVALTGEGAGKTVQWTEGIALPRAMPGSGDLKLTAGVGHLASVVSNAADVLDRRRNNAQVLVASLIPVASLGAYFTQSTAQGDVYSAADSTFTQSIASLSAYTDNSYKKLGLMWRQRDLDWSWYRASVSLNAYGLLTDKVISFLSSTQKNVPSTLTSVWKSALENELNKQVQELRSSSRTPICRSDCYKSWNSLAQILAAVGGSYRWSNSNTREELSMERLFSDESLTRLSPQGLANAVLAYTLHGSSTDSRRTSRLNTVFTKLASHIRVQGSTAYVSRTLGSAHSAGLATNAAVLLALSTVRDDLSSITTLFAGGSGSSLVAKLAAYVAGAKDDSSPYLFSRWRGVQESAMACAALASHDLKMGSTRPDLGLTATSGNFQVLFFEARDTAPPPLTSVTPWEILKQPQPDSLQFQVEGTGQVSVSAALTFVPAQVPLEGAVYRGIYVEKTVHLMDPVTGKATGGSVQIVKLGSSVVVTIQITTPDDLSRVVLEDLSAGGLEPIDPNVAGDDSGSASSNGCGSRSSWWSWWCVPSFPYRETYADRVVWTSMSTLQAGTHTVSYQAIAATRGNFTFPPAYALVEDQPELMGLSQGGTVVVADSTLNVMASGRAIPEASDEVGVTTYLSVLNVKRNAVVTPVACPKACPAAGFCQLSTGKCMCQSSSSGLVEECPASSWETPVTTTQGVRGSGGTTATPSEVVMTTLTVENVDYAKLAQDSSLLKQFSDAVKSALAAAAGPYVNEEHVKLRLSSGSVIVEATITPPAAVSATNLKASLAASTGSLGEGVTMKVAAVPGISAVTTGTISTSGVQVTLQPIGGNTTPSASGTKSLASLSIRALPSLAFLLSVFRS